MKMNVGSNAAVMTRFLELYPELDVDDDSASARLVESGKVIHVPSGTFAFRKGDECNNLILVVDGRVRVQLASEAGREVVLYRVNPGGTCAITTSCLIGREVYPAEAVIEDDVTAILFPEPEFRKTLLESEHFRHFVFHGFSGRLCAVVNRLETVVLRTIDERLAEELLKGGDSSLSGITHQVLAAEIGTAREVVSRKLKRFEADGLIRSERGRVEILDRKNLQALSGASET